MQAYLQEDLLQINCGLLYLDTLIVYKKNYKEGIGNESRQK